MTTTAARKIETAVLHALAEHGQRTAAEAAGLSESRVSRFKSGAAEGGGLHLAEAAELFAALGLAVVPVEQGELVTLPAEDVAAMRLLARRHLER